MQFKASDTPVIGVTSNSWDSRNHLHRPIFWLPTTPLVGDADRTLPVATQSGISAARAAVATHSMLQRNRCPVQRNDGSRREAPRWQGSHSSSTVYSKAFPLASPYAGTIGEDDPVIFRVDHDVSGWLAIPRPVPTEGIDLQEGLDPA